MTALLVFPALEPLRGSVPLPADKSIVHRALMFAAISNGRSEIRAGHIGEDNQSTLRALESMGAIVEREKDLVSVRGAGLFGLHAANAPLDCGNSGTSMRLLLGLLAGQAFDSVLTGDASLSRRPMLRAAVPLRSRGAQIEGASIEGKADLFAPLRITGRDAPLGALEYNSPIASAQVKSALLISGLYAHGKTLIREPSVSRDHTERMLAHLGVPIAGVGNIVSLDPAGWSGSLPGFELDAPGDLSAAAFLIAAATLVRGSQVVCRGVGTNRTRTGFLEVATAMGASLSVEPKGESAGEPWSEIEVRSASLRKADVGGEQLVRAIDEVPVLAAMAAMASGETRVMDASDLRAKESDRIATTVAMLRGFGVQAEAQSDGLTVRGTGGAPLCGGHTVDSHGDHRIAMAAAVLGLVSEKPVKIENADCIGTSFPRFVGTLRALGARIEVTA
jgi:3-phosphoshikimate 1-carboxyvinyltransferase